MRSWVRAARAQRRRVSLSARSRREMIMQNRSMPPGDVIPEMPYRDIAEAVAWLGTAFGFRERLRIAGHRAQILVGSGSIVAVQSDAPAPTSVMVRVADVDAHHGIRAQAGFAFRARQQRFRMGSGNTTQSTGGPSLGLLAISRGRGPRRLGRATCNWARRGLAIHSSRTAIRGSA